MSKEIKSSEDAVSKAPNPRLWNTVLLITLIGNLSSSIFLVVASSIGFLVVDYRLNFLSIFEDVVQIGDDCQIGKFQGSDLVKNGVVDDANLKMHTSPLPYRRVDAKVSQLKPFPNGSSVRVKCELKLTDMDRSKDIYLNWGPFVGKASFDLDNVVVSEGSFSGADGSLVVIPKQWQKDRISVGFIATQIKDSNHPPGPSSLIPLYVTQDFSKISKIESNMTKYASFSKVISLGALLVVLGLLLFMLIAGAWYLDTAWMTISTALAFGTTYIAYRSYWGSYLISNLNQTATNLSIYSLAIAIVFYSRSHRLWRLPQVFLVGFVILEAMNTIAQIKFGWRYTVVGAYGAVLISGIFLLMDSYRNRDERFFEKSIFAIVVIVLCLINIPLEASARSTGIYFGDIIQLALSIAAAFFLGVQSAKNLIQSKKLKEAIEQEIVNRKSAEGRYEFSSEFQTMNIVDSRAANGNSYGLVIQTEKIGLSFGDWLYCVKSEVGITWVLLGQIHGNDLMASMKASRLIGKFQLVFQLPRCNHASSLSELLSETELKENLSELKSYTLLAYRENGHCEMISLGMPKISIGKANGAIEVIPFNPLELPVSLQEKMPIGFVFHVGDSLNIQMGGVVERGTSPIMIGKVDLKQGGEVATPSLFADNMPPKTDLEANEFELDRPFMNLDNGQDCSHSGSADQCSRSIILTRAS
ncbi:MAG: hypothetical protein NT027_02635 [Proteobacteria bacterium]|nr:hypothetical protein [Pseudomonadota bacterium]